MVYLRPEIPEPCFNVKTLSAGIGIPTKDNYVKMQSSLYRNPHNKDKMLTRLSYPYNGNSHTGKMASLLNIIIRITIECMPECKLSGD